MPADLVSLIGNLLKKRPWHELPRLLAMHQLIGIRNDLRAKNLYDTEEPPLATGVPTTDPAFLNARTPDGSHNDLRCPHMGAAGRRFGRNVPLDQTFPDAARLMVPNPREVSRVLMTRDEFKPATILNLLAAAWIQFMVHDWFAHALSSERAIDIPTAPDDDWGAPAITVPASLPDPAPPGSTRPPAYANLNSHWWDASQIYGSDADKAMRLRARVGGRMRIEPTGLLPVDPETGVNVGGFTDNWWIGLAMLHTLFTLEHNHLCSLLAAQHPDWDDDQLYAKAKLINAALMAKIHTLEWTTAILPHPVVQAAMKVNWSGLTGQELQDALDFIDDNELIGGIVGSKADHHSAPYLAHRGVRGGVPDAPVDSRRDGVPVAGHRRRARDANPARGLRAADATRCRAPVDARFAVLVRHEPSGRADAAQLSAPPAEPHQGQRRAARPGGRRHPSRSRARRAALQRLQATVAQGAGASFEDLTDNPTWREQLRQVYANDIELVDLMTGLYAEPLPKGFGFSETAFRIFVLMASRRLKSDRFFTDSYTPEVYTQFGLDYIRTNTMLTVLTRHYPQLGPALEGVANAFAPWKRV